MNDNDRINQLHNQGEIDAANGVDRPPHDGFELTCHSFFSPSWGEEEKKENAAYQAGQDNHRAQTGR